MTVEISLTVSQGALPGTSFTYDGKASLLIGRAPDCAIVCLETTVSRYHCLLDIAPPNVMVRDLDSLNGTFVNGTNISQQAKGTSMRHGDRLRLGTDCEFVLEIHGVVAEDRESGPYAIKGGAENYFEADQLTEAQRDKKKMSGLRPEKGIDQNRVSHAGTEQKNCIHGRCEICHVILSDFSQGICESCRRHPSKVLMFLLEQDDREEGSALAGYRPVMEQQGGLLKKPPAIPGYQPMRLLGKGGMGGVWLVEEVKTGKQKALKLMLPSVAMNEAKRKRFLREAAIAAQLRHRNIVRHGKYDSVNGVYFVLMEPCGGGSVGELVRNRGKLSIPLATNIILQVLEGLTYAHSVLLQTELADGSLQWVNGIVHRDLQPENIILYGKGENYAAKMADFGLAKAFETAGLSGHTRTGDYAGTAMFMPRQQIIDFKYAQPAVDVWAAAACYYYMLTGFSPKDFTSSSNDFAVGLLTDAIPIKERNPDIPDHLAAVIDLALREEPDIGVQSAKELKKLIERAL